ncbi:hypothetical protein [Acinetobacter bereziniae]|nr:hypothetical protein [Acinetobacter bereziniae]
MLLDVYLETNTLRSVPVSRIIKPHEWANLGLIQPNSVHPKYMCLYPQDGNGIAYA